MTSREKAIEALDCKYQCDGFPSTLKNILIHEGDDTIIEIKAVDIWNAIIELKKPTLDDAIAVVEKMHNKENDLITTSYGQVERSYHRSRCGALYEVLTALKGLKGGKEKE